MSTTETNAIAPEVRLFLARVRRELADLDPDEVTEMTDGLEADLTELVADRGAGALGSPVDYANELRAAAGLTARAGRSRSIGDGVDDALDGMRAHFDNAVGALPGDVGALLDWLRPLWWVLRGWIAVTVTTQLVYRLDGRGGYGSVWGMLPLQGFIGWLALAVGIGGSVAVGRGLWPGRRRGAARVVLLALNVLALVLTPLVLIRVHDSSLTTNSVAVDTARATARPHPPVGLTSAGREVTDIYAYDASGKPLVGVQLFDQSGRPLNVAARPQCPRNDGSGGWSSVMADPSVSCVNLRTGGQARVYYAWTNGAAQLDNVFPLAVRLQDRTAVDPNAFSSPTPPTIGAFPMASAPKVSLPGITPSIQKRAHQQ